MRDHELKFQSGEYIHEYEGYTPFYIGNFYGSNFRLGDEEEFELCAEFFSGIGDVEWWIKKELDSLSEEQHVRLKNILRRNKLLDNYFYSNVEVMASMFRVGKFMVHRLSNREKLNLYYLFDKLTDKTNLINFIIDNKIEAIIPSSFIELNISISKHKIKKFYDNQISYTELHKDDYLGEINYDELFEEL